MARKPQAKPRARKSREGDAPDRVVRAALRLAGVNGWRDTTMADIAAEAGLSLAELRRHVSSKMAVLALFARQIDEQVLAGTDPDVAAEPVKDRLFDMIMRRLDALTPHKAGVRSVMRYMQRNPGEAACYMAGPMRRSLDWMLEAGQIPSWGPLAPLQRKGLGLIYLSVLRVWVQDEGEDLGRTMAALDKALSRADRIAGRLRPRFARRDDATAADGAA